MDMNNKNFESVVSKYLKASAESFVLPDEKCIKAFSEPLVSDAVSVKRGSLKKKSIIIIAATLALFVCLTTAFSAFNRPDASTPEQSMFSNTVKCSSVADWYVSGDFEVNAITLKQQNGGLNLTPMSSAVTKNTEAELPYWVERVNMLNDRYAELYYGEDDLPAEYEHSFLVYDIYEQKTVSLVERVYNKAKAFFESRNVKNRNPDELILIEKLCQNPDRLIFSTPCEVFETGYLERFMIDLKSGELRSLPAYKTVIAVSEDCEKIVLGEEVFNGDDLEKRVISVYNTKTEQEIEIETTYNGPFVLQLNAKFSENGRYVIAHIADRRGESIVADPQTLRWVIYDTESGARLKGRGRVVRFTENGDAIVIRDTHKATVHLLDDIESAVEDYELKVYEQYEFIAEQSSNGKTDLYLEPIFGNGGIVTLAENVDSWLEWKGYIYIFKADAKKVMVYSVKENEFFTCDAVYPAYLGDNYKYTMFVTDSGKKCNVVAHVKKENPNADIYESKGEKIDPFELELPENGEKITYQGGKLLYASEKGYIITVTEAYRENDIIYFNVKENADYYFDPLGISVLTKNNELFASLNPVSDKSKGYDYMLVKWHKSGDMRNETTRLKYWSFCKSIRDFNSDKNYAMLGAFGVYEKGSNRLLEFGDALYHDSVRPKEIAYEYKAVYTDKKRVDGIYPYHNYIGNIQLLNSYNADINELYVTDRSFGGSPSYDEWVTRYSEEWLRENAVIMLVVEANEQVLPTVEYITELNGYVEIKLENTEHTDDNALVYHIFIDVKKSDISETDRIWVFDNCDQ